MCAPHLVTFDNLARHEIKQHARGPPMFARVDNLDASDQEPGRPSRRRHVPRRRVLISCACRAISTTAEGCRRNFNVPEYRCLKRYGKAAPLSPRGRRERVFRSKGSTSWKPIARLSPPRTATHFQGYHRQFLTCGTTSQPVDSKPFH